MAKQATAKNPEVATQSVDSIMEPTQEKKLKKRYQKNLNGKLKIVITI